MKYILINILSFTTIISSVLVITSKNPVISVVYLISVFVNAAGYLILLGINFIGISYIVIYVGAIAVLFLFIILMINIKLTDISDTGYNFTKNLPMGLNIASLLLFIFFSVAIQVKIFPFFPTHLPLNNLDIENGGCLKGGLTDNIVSCLSTEVSKNNESSIRGINSSINYSQINEISDINLLEFTQIEVLGHLLYTYASIFLIILSLILLLAMLAIIIISKKNIRSI